MTHPDLTDRLQATRTRLQPLDQSHLLTFADELTDPELTGLLDQIDAINWDEIDELVETYVQVTPELTLSDDIQPAPYYPLTPTPALEEKYRKARALGDQMLRDGRVAAFTVAGGQGTRLGHDGPKGTYPATPIHAKPLFQVFAEYILKVSEKYGRPAPWYIMTSPINDAPTRDFFAENDHFGLDPADVIFFPQGTMPSIGYDGRLLLASKSEIAVNPDGHGGSLRALYTSGAINDMENRGITQISYFQVDNPNVKCIDPLFLGLHTLDEAEMSSKMLAKTGPLEKVGNFALIDGRVAVIEYSDMPDFLAQQRDDEDNLRFNAGSIAIHIIARDFVKRLNTATSGRFALPYHRADKKVPYLDPTTGKQVTPDDINAVKLETFVFDALPLASQSIILETDRIEEFAPIKNATGTDSADSSKRLQSTRAARWLAANGITVPLNADATDVQATIELSHRRAIEPSDLDGDTDLPQIIHPNEKISL